MLHQVTKFTYFILSSYRLSRGLTLILVSQSVSQFLYKQIEHSVSWLVSLSDRQTNRHIERQVECPNKLSSDFLQTRYLRSC